MDIAYKRPYSLDMAVRGQYHPGKDPKIPRNESDDFTSGIESLLKEGKVERSDIPRRPRKAIKSIESITRLLNEYYKNPDKYASTREELRKQGRYLKDPTFVGVYDDDKHSVARTDTKSAIEVNINFDSLVKKIAKQYGLKKSWAEEFVLTHELAHMAQPSYVLSAQPQPIIQEYDNEIALTKIFLAKAEKSKKTAEKEKYTAMANASYTRAMGYEGMLKQYSNNKNIRRAA